MSLGNDYYEPWILVSHKPKTVRRLVEDASGNEVSQKAKQYTLVRKCRGFNITIIPDATGSKQSSFTLDTGPDTETTYSPSGKAYVCDDDTIDLVDEEAGEYIRTQIWSYQDEFADISGTEFTPDE